MTTTRSAWVPTSAPVAVTSQASNGAAVSVQMRREPRNSSTCLIPAAATGVKRTRVVPESVLGACANAIVGGAGGFGFGLGAGQVTVTVVEADFVWPAESITTAV